MIPLVMSWAVTVHKAQGATLIRALLSVGPDEKNLGLLFVAISRVRSLGGLALDMPMDEERLLKIVRHRALPWRKARDQELARKEEERLLPFLRALLALPPAACPAASARGRCRELLSPLGL